jgi:aminotransferase
MKKFSKIIDKIVEASSIRYNNIVYELLKRKKDIIVLSLGEAIFKLPIFSFKKLPQEKIHHYSHSKGIIELREKISKYFLKKYHVKFDPEKEIIITAGSKAVIQMIFMSILNPKDEVIIFEPYW